ncbi:ABC transporter ATP-binding protein [Sediminibacillus halophilus]|uniref:ABC-type nitrate/sulfonate/bicarbonate transport system, ATPase component n=1 Tax=Sediminibacillus halophilus TaxID=482461 RepID=A0A1G9WXM6_9BACI|nr:ABC transporter ATP-binding protein [Sediminibacillus halophilus]SDM89252.1 ABC-type nitrate/sulfonate/bicarbonate transport system, ATPase component [Sediminibacillus halophilus]
MAELSLIDISKSFGGRQVLENVSFSVSDAEFVSIVGPSGSGKSTLFHLIGGLLEPDNGDIYLDDKRVNGKRGAISYMPQSPSLLPWRTVLENVMLGGEIIGDKNPSEAINMMAKAGLAGYEDAYPDQLSGGMKQRAAFIRSMLSPQPLMCLDEPFSALDEFTRLDMQQWLLSMWEEHRRSILFVTHNIEEALFLSDRVIVLSSGPALVKADYTIPFTRPRKESMVLSHDFLEWKKTIYQELRVMT